MSIKTVQSFILLCCVTLFHVCPPHGLQVQITQNPTALLPTSTVCSGFVTGLRTNNLCVETHTSSKCVCAAYSTVSMDYRCVCLCVYICCVWHQMTEVAPAGHNSRKESKDPQRNSDFTKDVQTLGRSNNNWIFFSLFMTYFTV